MAKDFLKEYLPYLFGHKRGQPYSLPSEWTENTVIPQILSFEELVLFNALLGRLNQFVLSLDWKNLKTCEILLIYIYKDFLSHAILTKFQNIFFRESQFFESALSGKCKFLTAKDVQVLLDFPTHELTLFALLPKNRELPGTVLIKSRDGKFFWDTEKESLFHLPILGLSYRRLPFYCRNGQTPQGIYTIDSVMPKANNPLEYGKNRRLILNFIQDSREENTKSKALMPKAHWEKSWWKEADLARELGRNHLRIHGTGRSHLNPFSTYFPMVPTSGCLAMTETYFLDHQRKLLDAMMMALNLTPSFESETKIQGLLYVVEFDGNFQSLRF